MFAIFFFLPSLLGDRLSFTTRGGWIEGAPARSRPLSRLYFITKSCLRGPCHYLDYRSDSVVAGPLKRAAGLRLAIVENGEPSCWSSFVSPWPSRTALNRGRARARAQTGQSWQTWLDAARSLWQLPRNRSDGERNSRIFWKQTKPKKTAKQLHTCIEMCVPAWLCWYGGSTCQVSTSTWEYEFEGTEQWRSRVAYHNTYHIISSYHNTWLYTQVSFQFDHLYHCCQVFNTLYLT